MTLTIDHIVIYVQDLQAAIQTYQAAGFTVNYGGQHADGVTENALIVFADGTYLELLSLVEGKTFADAGFKLLLSEVEEGYTGFALQSDDLEGDVAAMQARGIEVSEIREGSRARPDGEILKWKMAMIEGVMTPFIIQDLTDRDLRVPRTPSNISHPNTVTGIHEVLLRVTHLDNSAARFGNILGTPLTFHGAARFELGTSAIVLTGGEDGGDVPYQLALLSDEVDPRDTTLNGARFILI